MTRIDERRVAFYCVADGMGYVPKAITALTSVRRFHPKATCVVIGRFRDDPSARGLIARHELEFAFLDLSGVFRSTRPAGPEQAGWPEWPSECFWWTYAYELLAERGLSYSCALDGDTLCVAPLALDDVFDPDVALAGVAKRNGRVNSGVLFFNHQKLLAMGFFEAALRIYNEEKTCRHESCPGYCEGKGDQGLVWELERLNGIVPRRVPNSYNHMIDWNRRTYREKNPDAPFGVGESHILHLLFKPWRPRPRLPGLNPVALDAHRVWWDYVEATWPHPAERAAHFGERNATSGTGEALRRLLGRSAASRRWRRVTGSTTWERPGS